MVKTQVTVDSTCVICVGATNVTGLSPNLSWSLGWGIGREKRSDWLWHWGDNVTYKGFAAVNLRSKMPVFTLATV